MLWRFSGQSSSHVLTNEIETEVLHCRLFETRQIYHVWLFLQSTERWDRFIRLVGDTIDNMYSRNRLRGYILSMVIQNKVFFVDLFTANEFKIYYH